MTQSHRRPHTVRGPHATFGICWLIPTRLKCCGSPCSCVSSVPPGCCHTARFTEAKSFPNWQGNTIFRKRWKNFSTRSGIRHGGVTPARGIEKQTSSQRGGWDWQKTVVGGSGQVAPDRDFCSYADGDAERPVFVPGSSGKTPHEILEGE